MITFNVVKETHGWAIRLDERMTTPFWSRERAVLEAGALADALRRHGACAQVLVENDLHCDGPTRPSEPAPSRPPAEARRRPDGWS